MPDASNTEAIIDPELPIVDPHHHLWFHLASMLDGLDLRENLTMKALFPAFRGKSRYLFDELLADLNSGHNIRATVYAEVGSMYRRSGPNELRSVGEVEFANGVAAMAASGVFTDIAVCAGIIGSVDLRIGDAAREVLEAHIQAGGGRYRGIRASHVVHDANPTVLGSAFNGVPHLLLDRNFRAGFRHLAPLGLSYDAWQLEYQLGELVELVRTYPDTQVIVNHVGGLFGIGPYEGRQQERFAAWHAHIRALANCPNVVMKLGGLGMPTCGLLKSDAGSAPDSQQLARQWQPYIETCIEAFSPDRCMFESNFPVDFATAPYPVIWNAFKRIVSGASPDEKAALFGRTAARVYRIDL
jgi:predicted TIM-barrel fold metal-dependent hydrolase